MWRTKRRGLRPASTHIRGVINLRGHVVPIVDMGSRLGLDSADVGNRACNIIVEMEVDEESVPLGFTVQAVEEVVDIEDAQIEAPPAFGTEVPSEYISGMGKVDGDFVTILDISKALAIDALSQLADCRSRPPEGRVAAAGERECPEPRLDRLS
ncbi:MAG: chemotaxis protein CheW [Gammaproteobacteria bacterium]